jgi:hypothetical protein
VSKFKKTELNKFDKLVTIPAGHMSRYVKKPGSDYKIDEDVQVKIFGKQRKHDINTWLSAGLDAYPNHAQTIHSIASKTF